MPHEWLPGRMIACFILIVASAAWCGAQHSDEARAQARLAWIRAHQTGTWDVAPSEGAFLRGEVLKVKAKRALEVGTSNGYSGIWIALGLAKTGGHLTTLEIDERRAKLAQQHLREAGLESPLVPPGGVIVAHNVTDLRSMLEDFIQAASTNPQLRTTFVNAGPGGFSVSVKLPPR